MRIAQSMAVVLAFASFSAAAEQVVGDTYVVPQLGYMWLDNDRNADDDIAYGIALGKHFSEAVSLELAIDRGSYDLDGAGADDLDLTSLSINALHLFARESVVSPFATIGVGAAHNDVENADSHTHFMTQAGLGLMIQVAERDNGARKFSFRPEIKARWTLPRDNDPQDKYLDYVAMLGFQFAFGDPRPAPVAAPAPAPAPEPPPQPAPPPPPPDSDGDGVTDDRDQCPNTPRGVAVDAVGCPRRGSATLQGVTFELNSANLTADSRPVLDAVAADLMKHERLKVELQGHTDSSGADAYNMQLSERRASSVREYLISQGVPPTQLVSRGYGETQPIADNKTNEGRAQNRRVEMAVLENPGDVDVEIEQPVQ
jgi:OmpA-OmpF porin, OOP family